MSVAQLSVVRIAADALGAKAVEVLTAGRERAMSRGASFRQLYGPTIIRIYQHKYTVDGVHAGVNCGWEGRFAAGCKYPSLFPEQDFPTEAWLILIAGERVPGSGDSEGAGLIAHEIVHNLTWGLGHNPANMKGFSYVRYVGDDFAVRYMDALGVHIGYDAYKDDTARSANPRWRAELTADAIASWALDDIHGPYIESIANYIRQSMVCDLYGGPDC